MCGGSVPLLSLNDRAKEGPALRGRLGIVNGTKVMEVKTAQRIRPFAGPMSLWLFWPGCKLLRKRKNAMARRYKYRRLLHCGER